MGTKSDIINPMQTFVGLVRTLRPKQWLKNGFIFIPLLFDAQFFPPGRPLLITVAGFVLLCMTAGTIYLVNDLVDLERDRLHPKKRKRPLPAGELSVRAAVAAAAVLPVVALGLGYLLAPGFALVLAAYLVLHIAYSFWLKNVVIVDVLAIAGGFVLRVAAGVALVPVERFSPWMYVFTIMLALFLAVGKRRQELVLLAEEARAHRAAYRDYNMPLLDQMLNVVTTSTLVVYSLYTFESVGPYENRAMMLTIPFVIYGIFRYLYLIHLRGEGGAPEEVVLTDRPSQINLLLYGLTVIFIIYIAPHNHQLAALLLNF